MQCSEKDKITAMEIHALCDDMLLDDEEVLHRRQCVVGTSKYVLTLFLFIFIFISPMISLGNVTQKEELPTISELAIRSLNLGPDAVSNLSLTAPIKQWHEAIPLGNGLLGGLLWGEGSTLKLSLDRGDLWDLRIPEMFQNPDWNYETLKSLVKEKNQVELVRLYQEPYEKYPYPTKLPVGRLELKFLHNTKIENFHLNLNEAIATVDLNHGTVDAFFSAAKKVAMLRIDGPDVEISFIPSDAVEMLGYPKAVIGEEGDYYWCMQDTANKFAYGIIVRKTRVNESIEIALTVVKANEIEEGLAAGKTIVDDAIETGFNSMQVDHQSWWTGFWSESSVRIPDKKIQSHYDLVQYFYGAASRRGAPPIPLQGIWTADEGTLPPWKGDYHHDLNTQLTYWAYLTSGHFDEGASFLDFMWNLMPKHQRFASSFFSSPGIAIPGVMALDGNSMGGWMQYAFSPTNGAWVAHAFYMHWLYTKDRLFLKERAYPYLTALAKFYEAMLVTDQDGNLVLPLSSSPEINRNTHQAWLQPNSNFDQALLIWLFQSLEEMAVELGNYTDRDHWQNISSRLENLSVSEKNKGLLVAPGIPLTESHRHHSHLIAIHPLGLLTVDGSERDRTIINQSLEHIKELGTLNWCGYSFSWMACLSARAGRADFAYQNLHVFLDAFTSRNGFHLNGDQTSGPYSRYTFKPFTLEGNFAFGQAVHEMLLQSWGGVIRIYPAVPDLWKDITFHRLRAEGNFEVSAQRRGGKTEWICIRANQKGAVRIRDPFNGQPVLWSGGTIHKDSSDYVIELDAGETLEGRLMLKAKQTSDLQSRKNTKY